MKSSRLRLELGATQAMPRLQMSPTCIGVVVIWLIVQVALPGLEVRFSDWAPYRFQLQIGGEGVGVPLAGPGPAQPPRVVFPKGSVGGVAEGRREGTSAFPRALAGMGRDKIVP